MTSYRRTEVIAKMSNIEFKKILVNSILSAKHKNNIFLLHFKKTLFNKINYKVLNKLLLF